MPVVTFPKIKPKSRPHDRPRPQSQIMKKSLLKKRKYEAKTIHSAILRHTATPKINKHIEIVMIPDRSSIGHEKANVGIILDEDTILEVLSQRYKTVGVSVIQTQDDLDKLVAEKPDLVFSGTECFGLYDEDKKQHKDIWFSDYLAAHNIAYIGSPSKVYKNAYDKVKAKKIALKAGIKTAQFFTTEPAELTLTQSRQIAFPVFVKPDRGGDSKGVDANSIAIDFEGLKAKVSNIYQNEQSRSLVETYLSGKEYTVGVFEDIEDGNLTAMPIEVIPGKNKNGDRILDFDTKKNEEEEVIKVTDLQIHTLTFDLAIKVFKALKATSHARIDIKMDEHGVPHFLEANLIPALGRGYLYRGCVFNQKMSYEQMIYKITDNALARHCSII